MAGLAAIVEIFGFSEAVEEAPQRFKLCLSCEISRSSEAEFAAGLMGIEFCRRFARRESLTVKEIIWRCDNQGVLQKARRLKGTETFQVENDTDGDGASSSLEQDFFELLNSPEMDSEFVFRSEHVLSSVRDKKQQACDRVSRWLRTESLRLRSKYPDGRLGRRSQDPQAAVWVRIGCGAGGGRFSEALVFGESS